MNRYQPSPPRTMLGVIACALTAATFGLLVVGPSVMLVPSEPGTPAGMMATAEVSADAIRIIPSVDVVASREGMAERDGMRVVQIPRKPQS
ncbi:MAG TPA: hypothetical protein VIK97_05115 [Casimicrobiaceae bacterium]